MFGENFNVNKFSKDITEEIKKDYSAEMFISLRFLWHNFFENER